MPPLSRSYMKPYVSNIATYLAPKYRTGVHIAFIFGRGRTLLAADTNRPGGRSCGAGHSDRTIHAERSVLKKVDHKLLQGAVLVVVRVNNLGELINSYPCHGCQRHLEKCMREYGLRMVYYS